MANNRFRKRAPPAKKTTCSCGNDAKLIKRRNFPHGRKSGGKSYMLYKCETCQKESVLNLNNAREAKK